MGISLHFTLLSVMFILPLLGVVHFFKSLRSPKLIRVFYPAMKLLSVLQLQTAQSFRSSVSPVLYPCSLHAVSIVYLSTA